jgi:hypothetical protein
VINLLIGKLPMYVRKFVLSTLHRYSIDSNQYKVLEYDKDDTHHYFLLEHTEHADEVKIEINADYYAKNRDWVIQSIELR